MSYDENNVTTETTSESQVVTGEEPATTVTPKSTETRKSTTSTKKSSSRTSSNAAPVSTTTPVATVATVQAPEVKDTEPATLAETDSGYGEIVIAPLADNSKEDPVPPEQITPHNDYGFTVSKNDDGNYVVHLTGTEVRHITNANGTVGCWVGVIFVCPEGYTKGLRARSTTGVSDLPELTDFGALDNAGDGKTGMAVYLNRDNPANHNSVYRIQWSNDDGSDVTDPLTFIFDLSGVTCADDSTPAYGRIHLAPLHDNSEDPIPDEDLNPNGDYGFSVATMGKGLYRISLKGTGLRTHKNGDGNDGCWAGVFFVAPTGAKAAKTAIARGSVDDLHELVDYGDLEKLGVEDGIACYIDISNLQNAVLTLRIQWDDNDPLTYIFDTTGCECADNPSAYHYRRDYVLADSATEQVTGEQLPTWAHRNTYKINKVLRDRLIMNAEAYQIAVQPSDIEVKTKYDDGVHIGIGPEFKPLDEVLAEVEEGTAIHLEPGEYTMPLTVNKSLSLIAEVPGSVVLSQPVTGATVATIRKAAKIAAAAPAASEEDKGLELVFDGIKFTGTAMLDFRKATPKSLIIRNCTFENIDHGEGKNDDFVWISSNTAAGEPYPTMYFEFVNNYVGPDNVGIYNFLDMAVYLANGSKICNNTYKNHAVTHNVIKFYGIEAGGTIDVSNNHNDECDFVHMHLRGADNVTVNAENNTYKMVYTPGPKSVAAGYGIQAQGTNPKTLKGLTVNINNNHCPEDETIIFAYSKPSSGEMEFTDETKPTVYIDGVKYDYPVYTPENMPGA